MAYEHRDNEGSLFINDKKTSDNQPDYNGKCLIPEPGLYRISGWKKSLSNGSIRLSLSFTLLGEDGKAKTVTQEVEVKDMSEVPF